MTDKISTLRKIVAEQSAEVIDGRVVDMYSAQEMINAYEVLTGVRARLDYVSLPIQEMSQFARRIVQ